MGNPTSILTRVSRLRALPTWTFFCVIPVEGRGVGGGAATHTVGNNLCARGRVMLVFRWKQRPARAPAADPNDGHQQRVGRAPRGVPSRDSLTAVIFLSALFTPIFPDSHFFERKTCMESLLVFILDLRRPSLYLPPGVRCRNYAPQKPRPLFPSLVKLCNRRAPVLFVDEIQLTVHGWGEGGGGGTALVSFPQGPPPSIHGDPRAAAGVPPPPPPSLPHPRLPGRGPRRHLRCLLRRLGPCHLVVPLQVTTPQAPPHSPCSMGSLSTRDLLRENLSRIFQQPRVSCVADS